MRQAMPLLVPPARRASSIGPARGRTTITRTWRLGYFAPHKRLGQTALPSELPHRELCDLCDLRIANEPERFSPFRPIGEFEAQCDQRVEYKRGGP
jgi:hypothetical protein